MANTKIKDAVKASPATAEQVEKVIENVVASEPVVTQKIYVGPNLLGLPTYTVVESDFTEHINGFIEKCPEIEKLFVPIAEMANTEQRAKIKGTLEHRHYQKVMAFKIDGGKGER